MNSSIITIGDELLIGQVVDTNSAWLADQLNILGISVNEIISVSDNSDHIKQTLSKYEGKVDLVFIMGGLGPTKDDITKSTLAEYFNSSLVFHQEVADHIEFLFKGRGFKLSESNKLQAMLPDNCKILKNPSGTAQGMWFERSSTIFISLPGVPYELKDIFSLSLLPELKPIIKGSIVVHKTIMTQGIPESYLSDRLKKWETELPSYLKLAYLPKPGIVRLRLTGRGEEKDKAQILNTIELEVNKVLEIISKDIYGYDDEPIEQVIGKLLISNNSTLSIAESCTGGNIAQMITSIPGSSGYFKGSLVAYSNEIKINILGVNSSQIVKYGAVSKEVVEEMAEGSLRLFKTDYAIATSGISGPEGGTPEKPVGTTWIAVASSKKTISSMFLFGDHRGRNIERASLAAINMLRKMILQIE